jgi:hypothetical protein
VLVVPGEPVCWFKSQVDTSSTYGGLIAGMVTSLVPSRILGVVPLHRTYCKACL